MLVIFAQGSPIDLARAIIDFWKEYNFALAPFAVYVVASILKLLLIKTAFGDWEASFAEGPYEISFAAMALSCEPHNFERCNGGLLWFALIFIALNLWLYYESRSRIQKGVHIEEGFLKPPEEEARDLHMTEEERKKREHDRRVSANLRRSGWGVIAFNFLISAFGALLAVVNAIDGRLS